MNMEFYKIFFVKDVKTPFDLLESITSAVVFYFTLVMMTIGLSMVRFAEQPVREIELPKEVVCEKPKF